MHHEKMNYGNMAGILMVLDHNMRRDGDTRIRSNENIDASRTHLNIDISAVRRTPEEAAAFVREYAQAHASRKLRDNQIVLSTDVVHLPSNWEEVSHGEDPIIFFNHARDFLANRYGYNGNENEVYCFVQYDEIVKTGPNKGKCTPHMHRGDVPLDKDGKLNHKGVHTRTDLKTLHKDMLEFFEERGYSGLDVYNEERAAARKGKALSMPEYKAVMEELDQAREDIEKLESEKKTLEVVNTEVEKMRDQFKEEARQASSQCEALKAESEQLRGECESLKNEVESLRKEANSQREIIATQGEEIKRQRTLLDRLFGAIESLASRLSTLLDRLKGLQRYIPKEVVEQAETVWRDVRGLAVNAYEIKRDQEALEIPGEEPGAKEPVKILNTPSKDGGKLKHAR